MKLSISVPNYLNDYLEKMMKDQKTTKSAVIQHAITLYLLMYKAAPEHIGHATEMIHAGQTQIQDFLDTFQKTKNNDN